jgi:N6-adenosine-specific RNA methylase IME4
MDAMTALVTGLPALPNYDAAMRALDKAVSVDEVKTIRDIAIAMRLYAAQAKNKDAEGKAVELRMRATRRLAKMIKAQERTVGLNQGAVPGKTGLRGRPGLDPRPTLASQGISKHLAQQARVLGALSEKQFEHKVADARRSAEHVFRRIVREAEIAQERVERRAQTALGGTIADLEVLVASGFRAGVIAVDPPWPFTAYSERAHAHLRDHYETMTFDEIKALPIKALAADPCAVFVWVTWPNMMMWREVIQAWGLTYSGLGFDWIKLTPDGKRLHKGQGYNTRSNPEPCLLVKNGNPLRLDDNLHSVITDEPEVIVSPWRGHSVKPDEAYVRMQQLYGGPYLELFARKPRDGWHVWGDELSYDAADDMENSLQECYREVRKRKAAGGKGWP